MKRYFVTGVAILLPLALTLWIVGFAVDLLTQPFLGITEQILHTLGLHGSSFLFLDEQHVVTLISKFLILISLFLIIVGIGAVARYFFFRYLIRFGDMILHRIPVISSVYKTSQELIHTIFTSDNKAFKQVVLVPFPNSTSKSIGLLTREDVTGDMVPVFIPTTPNPTSGYLIMFRAQDVIPIEMPVETALRYTISCGVLIDPNSSNNGFNPVPCPKNSLEKEKS